MKKLRIKKIRGVFSRDNLPIKHKKRRMLNNKSRWFKWPWDSLGLLEKFRQEHLRILWQFRLEVEEYLTKSGKTLFYSPDEIQERSSVLCGYWCLYYLHEKQNGKNNFEVLHNSELAHRIICESRIYKKILQFQKIWNISDKTSFRKTFYSQIKTEIYCVKENTKCSSF